MALRPADVSMLIVTLPVSVYEALTVAETSVHEFAAQKTIAAAAARETVRLKKYLLFIIKPPENN